MILRAPFSNNDRTAVSRSGWANSRNAAAHNVTPQRTAACAAALRTASFASVTLEPWAKTISAACGSVSTRFSLASALVAGASQKGDLDEMRTRILSRRPAEVGISEGRGVPPLSRQRLYLTYRARLGLQRTAARKFGFQSRCVGTALPGLTGLYSPRRRGLKVSPTN